MNERQFKRLRAFQKRCISSSSAAACSEAASVSRSHTPCLPTTTQYMGVPTCCVGYVLPKPSWQMSAAIRVSKESGFSNKG
mmetsp:Transcript_29126/g.64368  ORF Transcript_29126/g.64368 Transcript_29126/m.64368 type:complete len:81 (+) Transcript_29126:901-1143(+)